MFKDTNHLTYYANNTPDGLHHAYCWEYLANVDYGLGRRRDLVLFAIVDNSKSNLKLDKNQQPQMAVAVCNSTQGKSGKAKIVKIKRALLTAKHNLSLLESYKYLPSMKDFEFSKNFAGDIYSIRVENKTVNQKRVSNVTHIFSYLENNFIDIRGTFDSPSLNKQPMGINPIGLNTKEK